MWQNLTPQQQQFLMAMMMHGQGMPGVGQPGMMQPGMMQPGTAAPGMGQPLGNPLMAGGNSAISPQQQAAMQQYQALLAGPQGWGAAANGNVPVWQLMMGRSPMYGTGDAVP